MKYTTFPWLHHFLYVLSVKGRKKMNLNILFWLIFIFRCASCWLRRSWPRTRMHWLLETRCAESSRPFLLDFCFLVRKCSFLRFTWLIELFSAGPGILDPCEKERIDVLASLNGQQREAITSSAQHALRLIAFNQIYKVKSFFIVRKKCSRRTCVSCFIEELGNAEISWLPLYLQTGREGRGCRKCGEIGRIRLQIQEAEFCCSL